MTNTQVMPLLERASKIVRDEMEGLESLAQSFDSSLEAAVQLIYGCTGRLIVTGIGKSGHIGAKLASTFASTGTPAFFVHAAEAAHGDLGMIAKGDVVLAVSNSGNSRELFPVIDFCASKSIPIIGICSDLESRLGRASTVVLQVPVAKEVCPQNLAPTTSVTLTLVLGHVLAVLLMQLRSFRDEEFAQFHPGGRLGLRLQNVERYLENYPSDLPQIGPAAPIDEIITILSEGRKGAVAVIQPDDERLLGLITEGDLRRAYSPDMFSKTAEDIMTTTPITITREAMMSDATRLMADNAIANVVVVDKDVVVAILHVKELMQQGYL